MSFMIPAISSAMPRPWLAVLSFLLASMVLAALVAERPAYATDAGAEPIRGVVLDATTGDPIADARVTVRETDASARTGDDGRFTLASEGLQREIAHLIVEHSRHDTRVFRVRSKGSEELTLRLPRKGEFRDEVVVSAKPWASTTAEVSQAVDVVPGERTKTRSGPSIGEAVSRVPGVRNASTGEQAGKPVIRGLTNDRIRVMTNGFAHDHQQFSLRHPPNIEPYHYDRIEVIRGPASLLHGPSSMGGVVNLVEAPVPEARGQAPHLGGEVLLGFAGNNDAQTGSGMVEGASGGLGYRLHWTDREANETETPDRELPNTGYDQSAQALGVGYTFSGGIHVFGHANHWENTFGFFLPPLPDFRLELENDIFEVGAQLPVSYGEWTVAAHRAENERRVFPQGLDGPNPVNLELDSDTYRAELHHDPIGRLEGFVRVETSSEENATLGPVALLPGYDHDAWSLAVFEELRLGRKDGIDRWLISLGARYDDTRLDVLPTQAPPDRGDINESGLMRDFSAFTGALSVVHRFDDRASLAASVGRAWRPPSPYELLARGQHTGVNAFEIGNPELDEETNLNSELTFRWQAERLRLSAAVFRNDFDDHIYPAFTGETTPDGLDIVEYRQSDATIEGFEASATWRASRVLSVFGSWENVSSENEFTGRALPLTPPERIIGGFRLTGRESGGWDSPFVEIRAIVNGEGEASGPDELFSRRNTDSYTLYDLAAGIGYRLQDLTLKLDVAVSNLTDERYAAFLDTYKAYALSPGRNVRTTLRVVF
jgi:outer membrane receptor protein involved in Fe transport